MTSIVCPAFTWSLTQAENVPPGAFFTAMRSDSSCTAEQIEYERRKSSPAMSARSVRCWPCTKLKASLSSGGTSTVSATASRVSRATLATLSGWNLLNECSMRLEVVERFQAVLAAVLRLARRRAEARQLACVRRAATRAPHGGAHNAAVERARIDDARGCDRACSRRRDPELGEARSRPRGDPVGGPRRRKPDFDPVPRESGFGQCSTNVGHDHFGCRTSAIRRRDGDHGFIVLPFDIAHDPEVDNRDHRDLRIWNPCKRFPNRFTMMIRARSRPRDGFHHSAPG